MDLWATDPELTLRQLAWMVTGKRRDDWDHTASLKCQLANMFRDGGRAYLPAEFNPLRQHSLSARRGSCSVQQLTAAFVGI